MLRGAAALLVGGAILVGCGGKASSATPTGLKLQREDFIAAARALGQVRGEVAHEVNSAKAAWPQIANGVSAATYPTSKALIVEVTARAGKLKLPGLFEENRARILTGPGSGLAGEYRRFRTLAAQGWQLLAYSAQKLAQGSPAAAARFAQANIALYIETVYDAHFDLAQIGKQVLAGYTQLGGRAAFGQVLSEREVQQLAGEYSESNDRLYPHVGVKLGS